MKVIGLTGGIATGKSTAAYILRELGVPVVDADGWAHRLLQPGEVNYNLVIQAFGAEIVSEDRSIDRKRLGEIVFANPELRLRLETLTHPAIIKEIQNELSDLSHRGEPFAVLDHPLLFETHMDELVDEVWVVATSPEIQRKRLAMRDDLSERAIEERLKAQMPLEEKVRRADLVLNNDRDIEKLRELLIHTWKERKSCNQELHL